MMNEQEMKEAASKLMQYKSMFEEIEVQQEILEDQAKLLLSSLEQNERSKAILEKYSKGMEDDELLIHLGGDIFMHGKIKDRKNAVVGVGVGVYIQMDVEKALKLCEKRGKEIRDILAELEEKQKTFEEEKIKIASAYNALATKLESSAQSARRGAGAS